MKINPSDLRRVSVFRDATDEDLKLFAENGILRSIEEGEFFFFQGDPANREWHRENWHPDPNLAHPATRAMGSPVIYDNADRAAVERYNNARQSGLDDAAARQQSYEEWWRSAQEQRRVWGARGSTPLPRPAPH